MTSFEFARTDSRHSTSASSSTHREEQRASHRNTTPYGRHSGDWLFGSVEVRKAIKKGVKKIIRGVHHHDRD